MKNILALSFATAFAFCGLANASSVKIQDLKLDHEQGSVTAMNGNSAFIFGHHGGHHGWGHHGWGHHGGRHHGGHHGGHHGHHMEGSSGALPSPSVAGN